MKHTDEILHNHEQETSHFSSHEEIINNDLLANEFLYDEQVLRTQIKEKYKEHLEDLNNNQQKKRLCLHFIKNLALLLFAVLEQLWIEISTCKLIQSPSTFGEDILPKNRPKLWTSTINSIAATCLFFCPEWKSNQNTFS